MTLTPEQEARRAEILHVCEMPVDSPGVSHHACLRVNRSQLQQLVDEGLVDTTAEICVGGRTILDLLSFMADDEIPQLRCRFGYDLGDPQLCIDDVEATGPFTVRQVCAFGQLAHWAAETTFTEEFLSAWWE